MSPEREELVRASWRQFAPQAVQWAPFFYERLFELHPDSRTLFANTDMDAQGQKLMDMFGVIVASLEDSDELVRQVVEVGRRHVTYGVRHRDYASVGTALLWTLEESLGPTFTPETRAAWAEAYALLAGIMERAERRSNEFTTTGESPDDRAAR